MVASGLGIQFTAGAIGQAFRGLSPTGADIVADVMFLTNLMCLYIWWQAFRLPRKPKPRDPVSPVVPTVPHASPE
jgi:hypothetical protein